MYALLIPLILLASCGDRKDSSARGATSKGTAFQASSTMLSAETPLHCFFTPPSGWLVGDPKQLSGRVQISFLKKQEGFCPSINLAVEPTDVSQEEYIQIVQSIHENHHADRWRRLGKVPALAGNCDLTELDMTTEWGPVRLLQLILVRDGCAYIMTAAATKKEIASYYGDFQACFRSLQMTPNLIDVIPDTKRRELLKNLQDNLVTKLETLIQQTGSKDLALADSEFQNALWIPFEHTVMDHYKDMGAHWQILFLKTVYTQLMGNTPRSEA